ncbi:MAG: nucleoside phosphorylase [Desulfobulbaceae bacterium]|nr:nucleoside phosphorylase [Desulfobulbaceae bacterium]
MSTDADDHIIIHPRRMKKEKLLPENGLLLVNPSEASECLSQLKESGGATRFLFNSGMVVAGDPSFFAAGPSIGAPMAVLTLEKLIALGAKRVILFGWCGAISPSLKVGDIIIPAEALSGEGTSRYYCPDATVRPDPKLSDQVVKVFADNGISVQRDCVWSTDAVYREDRRMLKKLYLEKGVGAVDMEFSALCAVAKFRKIEFTAVLTVSDELWGDSWRPGFTKRTFMEQKQVALKQLLDHLGYFGEK